VTERAAPLARVTLGAGGDLAPSRRDVVFLTLAAASWGVGTVVSKRAVAEIPPFTLLAMQLASSLIVLLVLMRASRLSFGGSPASLAVLGVLNPGIAYALGLAGLTYISASLSVLLWALEPMLILLLAGVFLREGITPRFIGLSLVAATGMAFVVYDPASEGRWPGVVLTLLGIGCCAAYTVIARKYVSSSDSTAQVVLAQQAFALVFAVVVLATIGVVGGQVFPADVSIVGIGSAVASGVLYYAAAYWFYLSALRRVPAALAATSFYLIPIFGVVASFLVLGDRLGAAQWIGVAVVGLAVAAIARFVPSAEARDRRAAA
jgi:drug/metabolite transporter (DMT)-like permease